MMKIIYGNNGMSFRPLGAYVFYYFQFQEASPPAIFLRPFRSLDRDMTELIVFSSAGSGFLE